MSTGNLKTKVRRLEDKLTPNKQDRMAEFAKKFIDLIGSSASDDEHDALSVEYQDVAGEWCAKVLAEIKENNREHGKAQ